MCSSQGIGTSLGDLELQSMDNSTNGCYHCIPTAVVVIVLLTCLFCGVSCLLLDSFPVTCSNEVLRLHFAKKLKS